MLGLSLSAGIFCHVNNKEEDFCLDFVQEFGLWKWCTTKQLRAYTMQGVANPQYKLYGDHFLSAKKRLRARDIGV
jgi:hypothetical protein